VSYGVNALYERPNPYGGLGVSEHGLKVRLAQADRLARATRLDMAQAGWRPTIGNYLGRITKARVLEAVREGAGERAAQLIDHTKKDDMAKEAEHLLADAGWLPEPLRTPGRTEISASTSSESAVEATAENDGETAMVEEHDLEDTDQADDASPTIAAE
jgi:ParB family transcriptional regulator, chromosome partitioning protein